MDLLPEGQLSWEEVEDWCIQQAAEKLRRDIDADILKRILEEAQRGERND